MKRPRWLGGREPAEEEGDDVASTRPDATAAERSARRTASAAGKPPTPKAGSSEARRALGERVGKATGDASPKRSRPKTKPKAEPKPKAKPKTKPKPKPASKPASKPDVRDRSGSRTKSADAPKKPIGSRVRGAAAGSAAALKGGARSTRSWVAATAPKLGRRALAAGGAIAAVFFTALGAVLGVLIAVGAFVGRPIRYVTSRLRRLVNAASRLLTPTRALAIVVAGAAVLLGLSQYADYRVIAIGNDAYAGVQTTAPAPETGRLEMGDPHSYVFVPVAIACLLLLAVALTGRWRLCRLITLAGLAAIVVAIVVDRPAGLDAGDAALAFDGVRATLLGGFYAQIAAGVLLIGSSSLLAHELRLAAAAEPLPTKPDRAQDRPSRNLRRPAKPDTGSARA